MSIRQRWVQDIFYINLDTVKKESFKSSYQGLIDAYIMHIDPLLIKP